MAFLDLCKLPELLIVATWAVKLNLFLDQINRSVHRIERLYVHYWTHVKVKWSSSYIYNNAVHFGCVESCVFPFGYLWNVNTVDFSPNKYTGGVNCIGKAGWTGWFCERKCNVYTQLPNRWMWRDFNNFFTKCIKYVELDYNFPTFTVFTTLCCKCKNVIIVCRLQTSIYS